MDYASLIEIEVRLTQILESSVAYWQHMACPQHAPINGIVNPNTSHDTTEINAMVMVEKLPLSSLTYAIIQALNRCFARISLTYKAMATSRNWPKCNHSIYNYM